MTPVARSRSGVIPKVTAAFALAGGLGVLSILAAAGGQGEAVWAGWLLAGVFTGIGVVWFAAIARARLVLWSDGTLERRWLKTYRVDTNRLRLVRFEPEAPPAWHPNAKSFGMFNLLLEDDRGGALRLQAGLLGWSRPWEVLRPVVERLESQPDVVVSPNNWEKLRELAGLAAVEQPQRTAGTVDRNWVEVLAYHGWFIYQEVVLAAALVAWPGFVVLVRRARGFELTTAGLVVESALALISVLGLTVCALHWRALRRKRLRLEPSGRVSASVHAGRFRWEQRTVDLGPTTRARVEPDIPYPVPPDAEMKPGTVHKLIIDGPPAGPVEMLLADNFEPSGHAWPQLAQLLEGSGASLTPTAAQTVRYLAGATPDVAAEPRDAGA